MSTTRIYIFNVASVHASTVDQESRESRLRAEIKRLVQAWNDPALTQALSSFGAFCGRLGLSEFPDFFLSSKAEQVEDWSRLPLSEGGEALRDRISAVSEVSADSSSLSI